MALLMGVIALALLPRSAHAQTGGISGIVTDSTTGSGLGPGTVQIYTATGGFQASVLTTAGTGAYTATGLAPGTYYARTFVAFLNYVDEAYNNLVCVPCSITTSTPISVSAGMTTSGIDFALSPGGSISGTVTDAGTSAGLNLVTVSIVLETGSTIISTSSNASGAYVASGLPPGTYFARTVVSQTLNYVDEAYGDLPCAPCSIAGTRPITVIGTSTTAGINFALSPGGSITGTVSDITSGSVLSGIALQIYSSTGSFVKTATSNASGVYVATGLLAGTYFARTSISVAVNYIESAYFNVPCLPSCNVIATTPIVVSGTATTSGINFPLTPGGVITGTVTDAGTSAGLAVTVQVYSSTGSSEKSAFSNASGFYVIAGLPAGTHYARTFVSSTLNYVDEAYNNIPCVPCSITTSTPIAVSLGVVTSGRDFGLSPGGTITGTVTDAGTGAPLGVTNVQIYSSTGAFLKNVSSNAAGVYTATGLPAGNYFARTFVSTALNYVDEAYNNISCVPCTITTTATITVVGTTTTAGIDFPLSPGGIITGTVTQAVTGTPRLLVSVSIFASNGQPVKTVQTNAAGVYAAKGLPAGTYFARTNFSPFHVSELYNNIPCPYTGCSPTSGTQIAHAGAGTVGGINFSVALNGPHDIVVDFGAAYGLWTLSPWSTWQQVHGLNPVATVTGDLDGNGADDLVVDFGAGIGLYAWMNHTTWTFLHPFSPTRMVTGDLDNDGRDELVTAFSGYGVWRWSNGGWGQLHGLDVTQLAVGRLDGVGGEELIVDFPGYGLYIFANNSTWSQLHPLNASVIVTGDLDASGRDEVLVVFPGLGLWEYRNNSTWQQLHPATPVRLATGRVSFSTAADLVVDFGPGTGLWILRFNTTWSLLHGLSSQGFVVADRDGTGQDEVIINFGAGLGIWEYTNNRSWSQLHGLVPEGLGAGRLH